jgi:4-diphosphocytidyl-2-C-methyl-D-erythritol kinase
VIPDPTRRLAPVVRLAPAKLNLTLAVIGPRPDGYHDLHSVMVPLGLADRLSLAAAAGEVDTLHVTGPDAGPVAENLVLRAIALAREAVGAGWRGAGRPPALAARLEKRIPVAAGLGGGSSDAAAALDASLEAWGAELGPAGRAGVSVRLGSDVPFFLACRPAVVEGRGERVTALPPMKGEPLGVLLVAPPVAVPTRDVFATYAAGIRPADRGAARASSDHLAAEASHGLSGSALLARAGVIAAANDLLPATLALVPGLLAFRRALLRLLGRPVGQSGSGPTCFVLYPSLGEAETAAETVEAALAAGGLPAVVPMRSDEVPRPGARATTTVLATTIEPGGDADASAATRTGPEP